MIIPGIVASFKYPIGNFDLYWDNVVLAMHMDQSVVSDPLYATQRTLPISGNWQDIAWNGTVFCLINYGWNQTLTSPDGKTWTQGVMPSNANWKLIESNGDIFCAVVTGSSTAATSTDGLSWTPRTLPTSPGWSALKWNGSVFCLTPESGTTNIRSSNGISWSFNGDLPSSGTWRALGWNGSVFCAIKQNSNIAATSPDGLVWTQRTMPASLTWMAVEWNGSIFCAIASGTNAYATSPDGINWTPRTLPVNSSWTAIAWTGEYFYITNTGIATALISQDGITWTQKDNGTTNNIQALSWNGTTLCGASSATSTVWTIEPSYAFTDLKGHTVTPNGRAIISTAQSKFGGASAYFNGVANQYLRTETSTDFGFSATEPFTIEFFFYISTTQNNKYFFANSRAPWIWIRFFDNTAVIPHAYGSDIATMYGVNLGQWNHLVIVGNGSRVNAFLNGVKNSGLGNPQVDSSSSCSYTIGSAYDASGGATGPTCFIDDLRITKGVTRYTENFTPPNKAFDIGN